MFFPDVLDTWFNYIFMQIYISNIFHTLKFSDWCKACSAHLERSPIIKFVKCRLGGASGDDTGRSATWATLRLTDCSRTGRRTRSTSCSAALTLVLGFLVNQLRQTWTIRNIYNNMPAEHVFLWSFDSFCVIICDITGLKVCHLWIRKELSDKCVVLLKHFCGDLRR